MSTKHLRTVYNVMTVSPSDLRRKATNTRYQHCCMEDGILFLAGGRANSTDVAVAFMNKKDAKNAICRTKRYIKKHNLIFWGDYKIIPCKIL
jgi:hypothetical protein